MPKTKDYKPKSLRIPKIILATTQLLAFISTKLVTRFVARLFVSPIKHKTPKREIEMETKSTQLMMDVPAINKKILTYHYGKSDKKILLVHGWSGRGTQLFKIAEELVKNGYSTVSFDAPAHGKSPGKTAIMMDFIESVLEIEKQFGPFEATIGHSLGGMSVLNAIKRGLKIKNATVIGSGDVVQDIINDFISNLKLHHKYSNHLTRFFEKKYGGKMDDYSSYKAASLLSVPVLVIHDYNDTEVPATASIHIHKHLQKGTLLLTHNLGHRKILGDKEVIDTIITFVKKTANEG